MESVAAPVDRCPWGGVESRVAGLLGSVLVVTWKGPCEASVCVDYPSSRYGVRWGAEVWQPSVYLQRRSVGAPWVVEALSGRRAPLTWHTEALDRSEPLPAEVAAALVEAAETSWRREPWIGDLAALHVACSRLAYVTEMPGVDHLESARARQAVPIALGAYQRWGFPVPAFVSSVAGVNEEERAA